MDDQTNNPLNGVSDVVTSLKAWGASPFNSNQNLFKWFLWVGLLIVMATIWFMILKEVEI